MDKPKPPPSALTGILALFGILAPDEFAVVVGESPIPYAANHPYVVYCENGCCELSRHATAAEAVAVCPPGCQVIGPPEGIEL
jgi:hypothetical protein